MVQVEYIALSKECDFSRVNRLSDSRCKGSLIRRSEHLSVGMAVLPVSHRAYIEHISSLYAQ
jgi:hypothetical protein